MLFLASPLACATEACFVMVSRAQVGAAVDFGILMEQMEPFHGFSRQGSGSHQSIRHERQIALCPLCASGCKSVGWRHLDPRCVVSAHLFHPWCCRSLLQHRQPKHAPFRLLALVYLGSCTLQASVCSVRPKATYSMSLVGEGLMTGTLHGCVIPTTGSSTHVCDGS